MLGFGGILAISEAFYAIGRSEDRDRAAAERADREGRFSSPRTPPAKGRPRVGRRRDHR